MIYVLFGPPGVGKTYIGELISRSLNLNFFDADELITDDVRDKLINGTYSQIDREKFVEKLINKIQDLIKKNSDLVIAEAFTKEVNRLSFKHKFSQTKFIFVHAPYLLAKERAVERFHKEKHSICEDSVDRLWNEFDTPEIDHEIIDNAGVDDVSLIKTFSQFMSGGIK